jgi:Skp family chaperone for outer membrane proteins
MTKKVLLFAFLILNISSYAQRAQRIGYIDMAYILENLPEYQAAQAQIDAKVVTWQKNLDKLEQEIVAMRTELNNEKALLTKDLIAEKEEDIQIREMDLKRLQGVYFGVDGDLFLLRQQLVKPIQDLVFNAVQDIASKRNYDFVLDKSSDLIMLYSNADFDISEQVITSITRAKKIAELNAPEEEVVEELSPQEIAKQKAADDKVAARELKKEENRKRLEDKRAAQLKKREELKKAIEERRQARLKEIEAAKKAKEQKKKNN